jgi:hypothetical protein
MRYAGGRPGDSVRRASVEARTRAEGTLRIISLRHDDLDARFPGLLDLLTR